MVFFHGWGDKYAIVMNNLLFLPLILFFTTLEFVTVVIMEK